MASNPLQTGLDRARGALWSVPTGLQLSVLYTLLLAATLALLGAALYTQLESFLINNQVDRLQRAAQPLLDRPEFLRVRDFGRRGEPSSGRGQGPSSEVEAASLVRALSSPDVTVAVLDLEGGVITSTQSYGDDPRTLPGLPESWLEEVLSQGKKGAHWVLNTGEGRQLVLVRAVNLPGPPGSLDTFLLEQAASMEASDALLNQLRLYVVLGIVVGTLIGVVAGMALTRVVLRPLERMVTTAEAVAEGDLTRRLRMPGGRNEVARLGRAFDHMVSRLGATLDAQRRFVADASHELRTPLTSLEGLSEMLLMGADRGDSRVVQRTVRSMHGELARLSRLVADLLTLSRLDSSTTMHLTEVDAGKVLHDVAAQMAPIAEAREVRLSVGNSVSVPVQADPDRLKQVVLNLVDNAVRYTPPGGEVRMSAAAGPTNGEVRLHVEDQGPGIPPEDLPHIFDRFYRADQSRARTTGNTGLGLAIVRAIVEAHRGSIEVQSTPGRGSRFTITLPASASSRQ